MVDSERKSIMKLDTRTVGSSSITLEDIQDEEYQEAVQKGFNGTQEEYKIVRDYT